VLVCWSVSGRTVEFVFDQTQVPIISSKYWDIATTSPKLGITDTSSPTATTVIASSSAAAASGSGSGSRSTTTTGSDNVSSWKRPASSQVCHLVTGVSITSHLPCHRCVTSSQVCRLFLATSHLLSLQPSCGATARLGGRCCFGHWGRPHAGSG